ncbi:FliG C-terminal domain-containing protein [Halobacteriovorax marinus]|uniref:FliG C-terminal domain-containing protein n=1 Tax=Halobacteriovorax marinus TaxID=97084 RepID=UPI0002F4732A|nr:FliG C-terminal domain-containing protein [Halobacteriovorax marinus]
MLFKGGVREAAKILSALSMSERERILKDIASKDPQTAELLRKNLITFEDLKLMTVKMLAELLREIKIYDLALGLRMGSKELQQFILSNVSSSIKEEILQTLNGPVRPVSEVEESIARIMQVVREKVEKGELILSTSSEELV